MKLFNKIALIAVLICYSFSFVQAQDTSFLIGDNAPAIKYSKWLKGEPVSSYDKDKMYVVEFWATWCGPCIAAMPHLSELAEKYKGKVVFVGVNVWEKIGDKPYETVLPNVTKFVNNMGTKMSYNVAVDDNSLYMSKNWLRNAGMPGIPATFLIKEGKLVWLGHPNKLDSIINLVQEGKYDVNLARQGHMKSQSRTVKAREDEKNLLAPIEEAITAKDYDKAFELMDRVVAERPQYNHAMKMKRFTLLLEKVGEKDAIKFAEERIKREGARSGMYFAQVIADKDGFSKETYRYAAEWFKPAAEGTNVNPLIISYLAKSYYLAGDYANAVSAQEKAVAAADEALKNNKWGTTVQPQTLVDYKKTLKEYQKALKGK